MSPSAAGAAAIGVAPGDSNMGREGRVLMIMFTRIMSAMLVRLGMRMAAVILAH